MHIILSQRFNPRLIYQILSKLQIYANKNDNLGDYPVNLDIVVEVCNSFDFWKDYIDVFEVILNENREKISIVNKFLW